MDNAGNLIDASAVAMMAALLYFRKSAVEILESGYVKMLASHESEPTPLSIHHIPLSSTMLIFNNGESSILDPTEREEMCLDCRITYSFNIHRELCMLEKLGGMAMTTDTLLRFAKLAFANIESRIKELKEVIFIPSKIWCFCDCFLVLIFNEFSCNFRQSRKQIQKLIKKDGKSGHKRWKNYQSHPFLNSLMPLCLKMLKLK